MRDLTADAGGSLVGVLAGPTRSARVLAAFPTAVYLLPDRARAIAIEAADGVGLPNALRLPLPAAGLDLASVPLQSPAAVGDGQVRIGGMVVTVDHWVDHTYRPAGIDIQLLRERLDHVDAALVSAEPLSPVLAARAAVLEDAVADGPADILAAAGRALVGLGGGLTPSGDDVLCGLLGGGRTLARALRASVLDESLRELGAAVAVDAGERTTALSAALLWHAARGELARPARGLLRALLGRTPVAPATAALLAVGHSSGRDLALGLDLGIRAALAAHRPATGALR